MVLIRSGGLPLQEWMSFVGTADGLEPEWQENAVQQLRNAFDEALLLLSESPLRTLVYNARKRFFQRQTLSENTLSVIRAEKQLAGLNEGIRAWERALEQVQRQETSFEQDLLKNYSALQKLARNTSLQRALLFASHDLLDRLPDFAEKMPDQLDKKDRRTALSLFQYATRALFKTSPLSRFTTLQCLDLSGHEITEWPDSLGEKVLVTPNVAILPAIYAVLLRDPAFFQSLRLVLNPCVTAVQKPLSWVYFDGEKEAFQTLLPDTVVEYVVEKLLETHRA
ncbi:MAG: lantibiotic dehydratase, partial [Saprospiraceae bacterium]|nr:lantibiotic dehydratase [Saprospiraceae bacterium]